MNSMITLDTFYHQTIPADDDAVGALFKQMARYPLLKHNEEIELGRQIRAGVILGELQAKLESELGRQPTLEELGQAANLTPQEIDLCWHRSQVAKRRMISSNLRLVVSIAKRYVNRGVPFLDLIQEGALGLNRATEKFDPDKGYKFSTYAYWWIRQGITRTIANNGRTVRLPIHVIEQLNKLKRVHRELRRSLNRNPSETELAEALEVSSQQLRRLQQLHRKSLSLNHRIGAEENSELLDLLEDNETKSPEVVMSEKMMRQDVWEVLEKVLTKREQDILALRYGLRTGEPKTLNEVSQVMGLSCERVRQIQTKAMRKLRRPHVAEQLKGWLERV